MTTITALTVVGTRPEAIKMAPVVHALRATPGIEAPLMITAQHRQLLDEVLEIFSLVPDYDLDVMTEDQSLNRVAASIFDRIDPLLARIRPDWVLVQGDTTTTLAAAIAAFYRGARVLHVEAGLRTGDLREPFPEEANRAMVSRVATLHCAATERARQTLLGEGIVNGAIVVTGNPVIDALERVVKQRRGASALPPPADGVRRVVVTAHRRESFGDGLDGITESLRRLAAQLGPAFEAILPLHPNPRVRRAFEGALGDIAGVRLVPAMGYADFVALLDSAFLILSDSGGIQEEAPSLGKPVLVLRRKTERIEALEAGTARLVGTDPAVIVPAVLELWHDPAAYRSMAAATNPYGDGHAAERIVAALAATASLPLSP